MGLLWVGSSNENEREGGGTVSNFRNFSFVCLVPPNDRESSYKGLNLFRDVYK